MVERTAESGETDLRVGDQVLVAYGNSKYRGQVGYIVAGENGSGFTPSFLSAYVQFDVRSGKKPIRTLRCASLALAPAPKRGHRSCQERSFSSAGNGASTRRELLEVLCSRLDALALRSEGEADRLIVDFAADVVSLVGTKR